MKRTLILAVIAATFLAHPGRALDLSTRPVGPVLEWRAADLSHFDPAWLQVKFVEGSNVRLNTGRFTDDSGLDVTQVNALLSTERIEAVRPTFTVDRATARAWKAAGEARAGVKGPDLSLWFDVRVSGGPEAVARLVNALNALPAVEIAHPVAIPEPAVVRSPAPAPAPAALASSGRSTPDFTGQQGYLYDLPDGLNAPAAWATSGGTGAGMKYMDVELCWTLDHEDFNYGNVFYVGGVPMDPNYEEHGTAVLGETLGQHNTFGVDGFAPDVRYGVVAIDLNAWPNVPQYFQEAVDHLDAGDVWLIELQMYPPGRSATPMEYLQVNYDVIWTGVWSRGVVCVEAGANGSQDLDDPSWGGMFNKLVRDSGAIMVAGGTPHGHVAEWYTNYGSRMDIHAWGSSIVTTGYGDLYDGGSLQTRYTAQFSGTSGASPMGTGCALALQGIARANLGAPLGPIQLRKILHDTGQPQNPGHRIGPRPDLARAVPAVLALAAAPDAPGTPAAPAVAYPNPFRSREAIHFSIPGSGRANLLIFDASGRCVRAIANASSGTQIWDGRDQAGATLAAGVYFYRIESARASFQGKIERVP